MAGCMINVTAHNSAVLNLSDVHATGPKADRTIEIKLKKN